jgi:hypothetical protein
MMVAAHLSNRSDGFKAESIDEKKARLAKQRNLRKLAKAKLTPETKALELEK